MKRTSQHYDGALAQDLAAHRGRAPWYRTKRTVSVADMLAALRRALLHAQYQHGHRGPHILELFPDALLTQLDPAAYPETRGLPQLCIRTCSC
jgi:hypothetical protein